LTTGETDGEPPRKGPGRSHLQLAVSANLAGRAWPILLAFVAVPLYIERLGDEAYGLVGAFTVLQAVCTLLDMGLGATLTRQLARAAADPAAASGSRRLVRTLEVPYWAVAAFLAAASVAAAGPGAGAWFRRDALPVETVRSAGVLMGLAVAAQLPSALYQGGLLGLQRQVLLNAVLVGAATVRVGGTLYVLSFVSPTIEAFFLCQLGASVLQTLAMRAALGGALPKGADPPRFDAALLRSNVRFAAGVAGITVVSLALTQADKIVLTGLLPLRLWACYSVASQVAGVLGSIAQPVFTAVFPRFSELAAAGEPPAEAREYHRASQLLSVLLFPVVVALAWHSREVILAWTGKPAMADEAFLPAKLLLVGGALNAVMHVPYAMMLAHAWTKLPLVTNFLAVALLLPLLWWAASAFGPVGAASVWVLLNALYVLVVIPVLHRRLLPGEKARWYVGDLLLPLAGALAGAALANAALPDAALANADLPDAAARAFVFVRVGAVAVAAGLGALCLAPEVRRPLVSFLRRAPKR
jgi:O-antigen/teichoic acid export membrane protein